MSLDYDPTDKSEFATPAIGVPTWVTIGECNKDTSNAGNEMLVMNVKVDQGEEGAGYGTKEYLVKGVNWKIRQVLRACGLDPDQKHHIDDIFFRERQAQVIFKAEDWTGKDGATRTSYKIAEWVEPTEPPEKPNPGQPSPTSAARQLQNPDSEPVDEDVIPF